MDFVPIVEQIIINSVSFLIVATHVATEECANVYTFIIHSLNMQLFTQAFIITDTRLIYNYSHSINLN